MKVKDASERDIKQMQKDGKSFAVFFYTPLCGTCKVGERMLNIVLEMHASLPLVKCNVNFAANLVQTWQISSIPCLAIVRQGILYKKEYAMRSVDHLYQRLHPLFIINQAE
ncbi:thioredoxin family protein [Fodinisporobacter ferrooxydans]|uniref:Thioredoxin family protein n=1 Tax=Fodinisporobacter ferrooxydans TaxID=2901836 RepID=A0ABY4CFE5_9BACL|nr:thioredoxin family protein [Alicyclobacillaceae bacterium MYW30-H2]